MCVLCFALEALINNLPLRSHFAISPNNSVSLLLPEEFALLCDITTTEMSLFKHRQCEVDLPWHSYHTDVETYL